MWYSGNIFFDFGLTENKLEDYEKLGFIKKDEKGNYKLTDRGKKIYHKNREFEKKWNEYTEG